MSKLHAKLYAARQWLDAEEIRFNTWVKLVTDDLPPDVARLSVSLRERLDIIKDRLSKIEKSRLLRVLSTITDSFNEDLRACQRLNDSLWAYFQTHMLRDLREKVEHDAEAIYQLQASLRGVMKEKSAEDELEALRIMKENSSKDEVEATSVTKGKPAEDEVEAPSITKGKSAKGEVEATSVTKEKSAEDEVEAPSVTKEKSAEDEVEAPNVTKEKSAKDEVEATSVTKEISAEDEVEAEREHEPSKVFPSIAKLHALSVKGFQILGDTHLVSRLRVWGVGILDGELGRMYINFHHFSAIVKSRET